jgi:hypothetical protein
LAAFAVGSWLLVTPHLSTAADTTGAAVVLTVLAGLSWCPGWLRMARIAAAAGRGRCV